MVDDLGIEYEDQNVHCEIAYSVVTDPNTGATEIKTEKLRCV